jgi:hypothetical protein
VKPTKTISHIVETGEEIEVCFYIASGTIYSVYTETAIPNGQTLDVLEFPSLFNDGIKMAPVDFIESAVFSPAEHHKIADRKHRIQKIVIPDSISVIRSNAFSNICCDTFVWPASCVKIRPRCFSNSNIRRFEGIDGVFEIGALAFENNKALETFDWPICVKEVPVGCFQGCENLTEVNKLTLVNSVKSFAFSNCGFESFDWPRLCDTIPAHCFEDSNCLKTLTIKSDFINIQEYAFTGTAVKRIDISNMISCNIADNLSDTSDVEVIRPFYSL